jgi:glycosyltransferase involved in cell wall biosynthesis
MTARLNLPEGFVRAIPNGIGLEGMQPASSGGNSARRTIGFLSRFTAGKGLGTVVDAFVLLRERGGFSDVRLVCAGTMVDGDVPFVEAQKAKLVAAGLEGEFEFRPRVSREEKITFLQELSVLSVPANYGEAFGLYLIEAMACGVPVVQPEAAAFPEIVASTGGGVLYPEAGGAAALAEAWERVFSDPRRMKELGAAGREGVLREHSMRSMAERFVSYAREVCGGQLN